MSARFSGLPMVALHARPNHLLMAIPFALHATASHGGLVTSASC